MPSHWQHRERDACGVGFISALDGVPSFRMTRLAVEGLVRLDHRGAKAADGTGDGAGLATQIPRRLMTRELGRRGITLGDETLGVVVCFLPSLGAGSGRALIADALAEEGLRVSFWRRVPCDPGVLGSHAAETMPIIEQAVIVSTDPVDVVEDRLYLARKRIERAAAPGLSIPSASARTVVYKGLFTASRVSDFYWDLRDPDYETAFAVFHQRYSTNTFPNWVNVQPFRVLAHNGEINTISANRSWMLAREKGARAGRWGDRLPDLFPFLQGDASDSASLDNVFELLLRSGRSLPHVKELLIPAAWENVTDLDPELAAFYEYNAFLTEPWDGPAAVVATDGISLLAGMDRNGLRPARWTLTPQVLLVASEAGVCPEEEAMAVETGQLGPGEMILFEGIRGRVIHGDELKAELASLHPYDEWIDSETLHIKAPFDAEADVRFDGAALARVFGYTPEERRLVLAEMASGRTPLGSMGNDTGLAALAAGPQRLPRFFHQQFAQVTNPPMDPIREMLVMSMSIQLGRRGSILDDGRQQAHLIELSGPVISDAELVAILASADKGFGSHWIEALWPSSEGPPGMEDRLDVICAEAARAVADGVSILVLSDRGCDPDHTPLPMLLVVGAVHHRLIDEGIRGNVSIVVVSGEPRDPHDLACLIGFGASAVNPYLAIDQVRDLSVSGLVDLDPVSAQENYREEMQAGLLKVMSKMGICTLSAYRGSELFEPIGIAEEVCLRAFRNAPRRLRGIGFGELAKSALEAHSRYHQGETPHGGFYKHHSRGERHVTSPLAVKAVQKAARTGEIHDWVDYLRIVGDRPPALIRDLLDLVPAEPIPIDEVESVERVMRRFTTAAMSHGALSKEAHETLAAAMNLIGGLSNSGEGGEDNDRFATATNSAIKQVASGRFGVTPAYLLSAEELQIKMAQGSKPGEGGQLPGHKVTDEIARLRHTGPGVTLISPPPHHDIYSIEDLAQLIYDLKAFNPAARVSVKLVSTPGVGTIAVGVVKAGADVITLSGGEGGTGASPLVSIKHAGSPWELGLAETHQVLVANDARTRVVLETDGGFRTGVDVIVAALLGAERFGFGTLPLLALGCKMVRQCHLNTCPVGITTQDLDLRAKYRGSVDQVVSLFRLLAEEIRHYLAALGARSIEEIVGRADLLRPKEPDHPLSADLAAMLVHAEGRKKHGGYRAFPLSDLSKRVVADAAEALRSGRPVRLAYPIRNVDRSFGARLSGTITALHGSGGLPEGTIDVSLSGTAGQSLGAWLCPGVTIRLEGTTNDYVGKGMAGGVLAIAPRSELGTATPHGAGNAVLYGATGGSVFIAGRVGQRFAVRNSGATAVVEGCSDHACEYMTGGRVLMLGPTGRNVAAGMTGGLVYVWDPPTALKGHLAATAPSVRRPSDDELTEIETLLGRHVELTGSALASRLLEEGVDRNTFWVIEGQSPKVVASETQELTPVAKPVGWV